MKKRIISIIVIVVSVILILFVANQEAETKYIQLEQRNAVPNIETTTANKKSIDKKVLNNYHMSILNILNFEKDYLEDVLKKLENRMVA